MKRRRHVADAELAILEVLWELGSATKREIVDQLYPGGAESSRATVQKLLERLEAKQLVARDRAAAAHVFRPAISRAVFAGEQLEALTEKYAGGSLSALVMQLVKSKKIGERERAELRRILEESESMEGKDE